MNDEQVFAANPERQAHIRLPKKELAKDKQRSVRYLDECEIMFRQLGRHDPKLRRIVVLRVAPGNEMLKNEHEHLMPIPFLALEGETIPDTDEVLLPLVDQIMKENAG